MDGLGRAGVVAVRVLQWSAPEAVDSLTAVEQPDATEPSMATASPEAVESLMATAVPDATDPPSA